MLRGHSSCNDLNKKPIILTHIHISSVPTVKVVNHTPDVKLSQPSAEFDNWSYFIDPIMISPISSHYALPANHFVRATWSPPGSDTYGR